MPERNNLQLSEELQVALEASKQAATLVMSHFNEGIKIEYKSDNTPVTDADRQAEQIIRDVLSERFPDYSILGEEQGLVDNESDKIWIIDPIDGTKNFVRQIPLFGIEIGLLSGDIFSVGVSNTPAMGEILCSDRENGAFCNGAAISVSDVAKLSEAAVTFSGMNLLKAQGRERVFLDLVDRVYRVRGFGDAFSFHLVATGRFEAVVQTRVNIWDVAGLVAIIEAAGGMCTDWEGNRFGRDSTSIVASNGKVHDQIIEIINS